MKKLIALLLAMIMVLSMAACGSSEEPAETTVAPAETTPADNEQVQNDQPENEESDLEAELKAIVGTAVDLNAYEVRYVDEEQARLMLIDEENTVLDYVITVGEGTRLQLPCAYSEALNAGWVSSVEWEENQEGNTLGTDTHSDASGNTINITIQNPTEETMNLADLWITSVTAGNGLDYTAAFDVSGISEGSTMANVVSAVGLPAYISYYVDEDYVSLKFEYNAADGFLTFYFDPETALVSAVGYSYTADIG